MNREKFAWLLSIVLVAFLAFQMPRSLAHRDDDYSFARTLIDIHRQVMTNYVEQPDEQKLSQGAIDGMLGQLDPFTNYVPAANQEQFDNMLEGSFKGVGIQLDQKDNGDIEVITPIDNSPAARAGVWAGDIIEKVNGEDIKNLKLAEVMKKVKGPNGTPVTLTLKHDTGAIVDLTMNREDIVVPTIKGYRRVANSKPADVDQWDYWVGNNPKIGYVRITQFTGDTFTSLKKVTDKLLAEHMQGLILDLRFDPGGRLDQAKDVVNLFVSKGVIVKVKGRNRPEEVTYAKPEASLSQTFPMVVMVNEHSASASEIVAGSLKDNKRALIVGSRSYGKGSVQELIPLEGGAGELKLTVAYYYLPSGRLVHRKKDSTDWGVDPQLAVPMDAEQEKRLMQEQLDLDVLHGPGNHPASAPATAPATQPVDPQLNASIDELTQDIRSGKNALVPATQPVH
jgi:carboxyl-terminal processing protease